MALFGIQRAGVRMQLVEAGGYTELNTQISQIEDCVAGGADAVVIGAISNDGLNNLVGEIRDKGFRSLMSLMACLRRSCPLNHWYHSAKWVLKLENFSPKNIPVAKKLKWRGSPDRRVRAGWRPATPDSPKPSSRRN